jgi:hypothetical protein
MEQSLGWAPGISEKSRKLPGGAQASRTGKRPLRLFQDLAAIKDASERRWTSGFRHPFFESRCLQARRYIPDLPGPPRSRLLRPHSGKSRCRRPRLRPRKSPAPLRRQRTGSVEVCRQILAPRALATVGAAASMHTKAAGKPLRARAPATGERRIGGSSLRSSS